VEGGATRDIAAFPTAERFRSTGTLISLITSIGALRTGNLSDTRTYNGATAAMSLSRAAQSTDFQPPPQKPSNPTRPALANVRDLTKSMSVALVLMTSLTWWLWGATFAWSWELIWEAIIVDRFSRWNRSRLVLLHGRSRRRRVC
jgi:hypothetical protein